MVFELFTFLVFVAAVSSAIYGHYNCNETNTVCLNVNEMAQFQTNNYPSMMSTKDFQNCNLSFVFNGTKTKNIYMSVVVTEILFETIIRAHNQKFYDISKSLSYSPFQQYIDIFFYYHFISQSGYIIFEEWKRNNCPMESISKEKPFTFIDQTQILNIRSSFEYDFYRNFSCFWQFSAPEKYGFKVFLEVFDVSSASSFSVNNSTDLIVNQRSAIVNHTYYNPDNFLSISLSPGDLTHIPKLEFQAYISIVKKDAKKIDGNCRVFELNGITYWTNIPETDPQVYGNNVQCKHSHAITANTELVVDLNLYLEHNADYVSFAYNNLVFIRDSTYFVLLPYKNGTESNVSFEFISDGSVQSLGFYVTLHEIVCECANPIIHCSKNENYAIMNGTELYCGSLACNFTIIPCESKRMKITLITIGNVVVDDEFKVIANGATILLINKFNIHQGYFTAYLNSSVENMLEAVTKFSWIPKGLTFKVEPFLEIPSVDLNIILSKDVISATVDTFLITLVTFEKSESLRNSSMYFIIYSSVPEMKSIYNNENLTLSMSSRHCFGDFDPYRCEIKANKFAIFPQQTDMNPFMVVRLSDNFNSCVFNETIFVTRDAADFNIATLATKNKDCKITILITDFANYYITHLWTTSLKEDVKVYIGTNEKNFYFEFNQKTSEKLINIGLFSYVYTVVVPKGAAIYLHLKKYSDNSPLILPEYPSQSYVATPFFGTSQDQYFGNPLFVSYIVGSIAATFTVAKQRVGSQDNFYFVTENGTHIFANNVGDSVTFKNQTVSLYFFANLEESYVGKIFSIKLFNRN